jgi:hypothetical protein
MKQVFESPAVNNVKGDTKEDKKEEYQSPFILPDNVDTKAILPSLAKLKEMNKGRPMLIKYQQDEEVEEEEDDDDLDDLDGQPKRRKPRKQVPQSNEPKKPIYGPTAKPLPRQVEEDESGEKPVAQTIEWKPPVNQTGDGRTALNDKYGY